MLLRWIAIIWKKQDKFKYNVKFNSIIIQIFIIFLNYLKHIHCSKQSTQHPLYLKIHKDKINPIIQIQIKTVQKDKIRNKKIRIT